MTPTSTSTPDPLLNGATPHQEQDQQQFSTGIEKFDEALGGGFLAGSAVVLQYPTASAGERLTYTFAIDDDHHTVYATPNDDLELLRSDLPAEQARHDDAADSLPATPVSLLDDDSNYTPLLEQPDSCLPDFAGGSVVLDTLTDYPADNGSLRDILATFMSWLRRTGSVAYLLIHDSDHPDHREQARIATDIVDAVIEYEAADTAASNDALHVSKLRHPPANANDLPITMELGIDQEISGTPGETF